MNIIHRTDLIQALYSLKLDAEAGTIARECVGICDNLTRKLLYCSISKYKIYAFVYTSCVGWSDITKPTVNPIANNTPFLWKGEQLKKRLSLLDHLILNVDNFFLSNIEQGRYF